MNCVRKVVNTSMYVQECVNKHDLCIVLYCFCLKLFHDLCLALSSGFAISLKELLTHSDAHIDPYARRGYLESSILEQLVTLDQLEPKGDNCKKVTTT